VEQIGTKLKKIYYCWSYGEHGTSRFYVRNRCRSDEHEQAHFLLVSNFCFCFDCCGVCL